MAARVATIIIEPRLLVREALESLMAHHSYRIVCGVGSITEVGSPSMLAEGPKLAILGVPSADTAIAEAVGVRKLWPDIKIILLFEHASLLDFQKLLTSQVDGCVPLSVSPETLISTLDLIMVRNVRIMVVADSKYPCPDSAGTRGSDQSEPKADKLQACAPGHEATASIAPRGGEDIAPPNVGIDGGNPRCTPRERTLPKLSEREAQILDGLVKGHANKVIARTCDITEATVKVHMKSILRKIQVANRTQAAIWALAHRYSGDEVKGLPKAVSSSDAAPSIM